MFPRGNCQRPILRNDQKLGEREREREREREKALTHFCLLELLQREEAARWGHKPRAAALSEPVIARARARSVITAASSDSEPGEFLASCAAISMVSYYWHLRPEGARMPDAT